MSSIIFGPIYSNCGKILTDAIIDYQEEQAELYFDNAPTKIMEPHIEPSECPYCGKIFERIIMPNRFPVKPFKEMRSDYD